MVQESENEWTKHKLSNVQVGMETLDIKFKLKIMINYISDHTGNFGESYNYDILYFYFKGI